MALTIDNTDSRSEDVWGRQKVRIVEITFDSSYPTGGEDFSPSDVGLAEIVAVVPAPDASGRLVVWDRSNEKLQVFDSTASHTHTENTEASYTQNATTAASTAAVATEVADATDLSSLTAVAIVVGR